MFSKIQTPEPSKKYDDLCCQDVQAGKYNLSSNLSKVSIIDALFYMIAPLF